MSVSDTESLDSLRASRRSARASVVEDVEPVEAAPVETVKEWFHDPKTDRYVQREVPAGSTVQVTEYLDGFDGDVLDLGEKWRIGRGQEMHARWANMNPKYHGTERQLGYAPVRPEDYSDPRFPTATVPGIDGKVITCGDLVLMELPEKVFRERRARSVERKKREMEELVRGSERNVSEAAARAGISMEIGVGQSIGGAEAEAGWAERAAEAEAEAQSELMTGKSVFGGFRGDPKYNKLELSGDNRRNYGYQPA